MSKLNIKTVGEGSFEDILEESSAEVKEIAYALRKLLSKVMPGITEVPWAKQKIAGYGVGPKKMSEHFCYIAPQKKYVNLGFFYGADLPDPKNLLEGTGKKLRHIKVSSLKTLEIPEVEELIGKASTHLPKLQK